LADSRVAQSASDRAEQLASSNDRATIIFSVFSEMIKTAQLTDEQRRWAETRWLFDSHLGSWARIITLIIGLVGATAVATEKVMHNGPRWRLYRSSYEDLAAEGWAFFNKAEKYEKLAQDERFGLFFEKVEKIIASRGQRYFVEIASLDEPAVHNGK
jgi:hypothetical protein